MSEREDDAARLFELSEAVRTAIEVFRGRRFLYREELETLELLERLVGKESNRE